MGKNLYQKIFESHTVAKLPSGQCQLFIGLHLCHEVTSPQAFAMLREEGQKVLFPERTFATVDHIIPTTLPERNRPLQDSISEEMFAHIEKNTKDFGVRFFGPATQEQGVIHIVGPEEGVTQPGMTVACGDSHTATHGAFGAIAFGIGTSQVADVLATQTLAMSPLKTRRINFTGKLKPGVSAKDVALAYIAKLGVNGGVGYAYEFAGPVIEALDMEGRMTICNMAIEAGAKNGIFPVDEKTIEYMKEHSTKEYEVFEADADAEYDETYVIDLNTLTPTVAFPHLPENTRTFDQIGDVKIDQVVIGSCTNGRIDDLRIAAKVLEGRKVCKGLRVIVFPATQAIYLQAMEEGLLATFIKAGAVVSTPTCGPCLGGHMGILAAGERAVATTNRNFVGRMGHVDSEVYLASPAVAAASAVTGKISQPSELGL